MFPQKGERAYNRRGGEEADTGWPVVLLYYAAENIRMGVALRRSRDETPRVFGAAGSENTSAARSAVRCVLGVDVKGELHLTMNRL